MTMNPKTEFHVISNTHWDREWRFPFERTRAMLVEMMDRLLDLLDRCEGFKYFHLDSHTIMSAFHCFPSCRAICPPVKTRSLLQYPGSLDDPCVLIDFFTQKAGERFR